MGNGMIFKQPEYYIKYFRPINSVTIYECLNITKINSIKINENIFNKIDAQFIEIVPVVFWAYHTKIKLYQTNKGYYIQPTEQIFTNDFNKLFKFNYGSTEKLLNTVVFIPHQIKT